MLCFGEREAGGQMLSDGQRGRDSTQRHEAREGSKAWVPPLALEIGMHLASPTPS